MFSYIKGELVEITTDSIVIDVGGIGYCLTVSGSTLNRLPYIGDTIKVFTYLYLREDLMMLYGFVDKDELDMFKMLISVSSIGPKGAIAILSTLTTDDLRFAILSGDAKAISKAPGIGGKTASRVILELKDKMSLEDAFLKKSAHVDASNPVSGIKNDAVLALTSLGYSSTESLKAVSSVEITEDMDVETVLKLALKKVSLF